MLDCLVLKHLNYCLNSLICLLSLSLSFSLFQLSFAKDNRVLDLLVNSQLSIMMLSIKINSCAIFAVITISILQYVIAQASSSAVTIHRVNFDTPVRMSREAVVEDGFPFLWDNTLILGDNSMNKMFCKYRSKGVYLSFLHHSFILKKLF